MRKVLLGLFFGVLLAANSFAAVNEIKVSGEIGTTAVNRDFDLGSPTANTKARFIVNTVKLRFDAELTENVSAVIEAVNERVWGGSSAASANGSTVLDIDQSYVKFSEFLGYPATFTLGRQKLVVGEGRIIGGGNDSSVLSDMADGYSVKKSGDGLRLELDYDPVLVDLFFLVEDEGDIGARDDVNFYGVDVTYNFNDESSVAAYAIAKDKSSTSNVSDNKQRLATFGVRGETVMGDNISLYGEAAFQNGDVRESATKHTRKKAYMVDAGLDYNFNNDKETVLGLEYIYASGDKNNTDSDDNSWDKMDGGLELGAIAECFVDNSSNVQAFRLKGTTKLLDDLTLNGSYQYIRLARSDNGNQPSTYDNVAFGATYTGVDNDNREFGQEVDLELVFDYTEDVQFGMLSAFFFPGQTFGSDNDQAASMVNAYMTVSF